MGFEGFMIMDIMESCFPKNNGFSDQFCMWRNNNIINRHKNFEAALSSDLDLLYLDPTDSNYGSEQARKTEMILGGIFLYSGTPQNTLEQYWT